jgi:GT2 family glycosyltransferase
VLTALAAQDYPNVRCLVMDIAGDPALAERVHDILPEAIVRRANNPAAGLGAAANEVRTLVAGSGFLWFLHDDVIPDRDTARLLLEEAYRSNVGIAGAKLVDADEPRQLISVGYGIDKFGETWQPIQRGELDQEQHDAVQDRFYLSSDCLLVRSDLFDSLGGFDETLGAETMDLDLCWRAHLSGARVLVAPAARARRLARPQTVLQQAEADRLNAADRLRTLSAAYSFSHLVRVLPQALLVTVIMAAANLVVGHWRRSVTVLAAWPATLAHLGQVRAKRKQIGALRNVPDTDLRRLQQRGSARLGALLRGTAGGEHRVTDALADSGRSLLADVRAARRWPTLLTGLGLLAVFILGSRAIVFGRMSTFGRFVDFPNSARVLVRSYLSDWRPQGLGRVGAAPTGIGLTGLLGVASFGHMGLARTLSILVPLALGPIGIWRLLREATSLRGRVVAVLVYTLAPLATNAISTGRSAGVLAFGAFPYLVHWLFRAAREEPFLDPESDVVSPLALGLRIALVAAAVVAFAPIVLLPLGVVVMVCTLSYGRNIMRARRVFVAGAIGLLGAVVLQLPWAASRNGMWASIRSLPEPSRVAVRFTDLLRFQTGATSQGWLGWLVLAGPVVAVLVGYGWRFVWAARLAIMSVAIFALAWLLTARGLPVHTVDVEVVLVPALVGVAAGTGLAVSSVELDLHGHQLSWRQPTAFLAACLVAFGLLPGLGSLASGRWRAPSQDASAALRLGRSLDNSENARVLWLGDPGSLPAPGWAIAPGFGYSITAGLDPQIDDLWRSRPGHAEQVVADALDAAANATTHRLGQLLGPSAVRYIIVRHRRIDGTAASTAEGLSDVLKRQLDLRELKLGDDQVEVYENGAWLPSRAQLSGPATEASRQEGTASLIRSDLSGSSPVLDVVSAAKAIGPVSAGEVYLASSSSSAWQLTVDGVTATNHPAFGWANSFTVKTGGDAVLSYQTGVSRILWVAAQTLLWLAALVLATGRKLRLPRRRVLAPASVAVPAAVAIQLDDVELPPLVSAPQAPVQPEPAWYEDAADPVVVSSPVVEEPVAPMVDDVDEEIEVGETAPTVPVESDAIEVLWASDRISGDDQ